MAKWRTILLVAMLGGCGGGGPGTAADDDISSASLSNTGDASSTGNIATTGDHPSSTDADTTVAPGASSDTGHPVSPIKFDLAYPEGDFNTIVPTECPCADNTETTHVVTEFGELWRFDPETLDFTLVVGVSGLAGCGFPSVYSMAVGRDGMAWLQYQDDSLRTLDINAPTMCTPAPFVPPPGLAGFNYGMGFVSESEQHPCDSLYGIKDGVPGLLVQIDTAALVAANTYPTTVSHAELTGTGAGQLFAFVSGELVELDKQSGAVLGTTDLGGFSTTNSFAFAAFAGDFFFFTESDSNLARSEVTQLDYDDSDDNGVQDLVEIVDQTPFNGRIVGAGVSTCAPSVAIPRG